MESMDPMILESVWAITADNASCNSTMIDQINGILQQAINENFEQNLLIDEEEDASLSTNYIETVPTSNVVFQLSCMAHTLHLGIKEGLKKCQVLDVAIGKFGDLLKKILGSPKLLEALAMCAPR